MSFTQWATRRHYDEYLAWRTAAGLTGEIGQMLTEPMATHSPIVASVPGASILELGDWGIRAARWEELDLVSHWRRFLSDPASYYRHLLAD